MTELDSVLFRTGAIVLLKNAADSEYYVYIVCQTHQCRELPSCMPSLTMVTAILKSPLTHRQADVCAFAGHMHSLSANPLFSPPFIRCTPTYALRPLQSWGACMHAGQAPKDLPSQRC